MFSRSAALGAATLLTLGLGTANAGGWGGYYIGLNVGTGSSETDTTRTITSNSYFLPANLTAVEAASAMSLEQETFVGGAQIGVNWPLSEYLMAGFELDAAGFGNDVSGSATVVYPASGPATFTTSNSLEQSWLGTARLRVAITTNWFMIYGTGGYAGSDIKFTQTFSDSLGIPMQRVENSEFRSGYSLGGGIEIMIESGASIRVEYLHLDLGDIEARGPIATGTTTSNGRAEVTDELIRAGINFQID